MCHPLSIRFAGRVIALALTLGLITTGAIAEKGVVRSIDVGTLTGVIVVTDLEGTALGEPGEAVPFSFMGPLPALAGDLVSFDIVDVGMGNEGVGVSVAIPGNLISSPVGNLAIGAGQAVMIIGTTINGTVTITGDGVLLVTGATLNGKVVAEGSATVVVEQTIVSGTVVAIPPSCPPDFTGPSGLPDGEVGILDFLQILADWGSCSMGAF